MAKGEKKQALNQFGVEGGYADQMKKNQGADRGQLFPFLSNELYNPEGFGSDTVAKMLTQGGEAVSGATGAANEQSLLNASRTGNSAAVPGIIGSTARSAMKQQSDNALNVDIKDAMLKEQQKQDAARQIQGLYGEDVGAALKGMGLQNESLNAGTEASKAVTDSELGWLKAAQEGAATGAMIAG